MRKLTVRDEQPADIPAIYALTRAAFAKDGRTGGNEQEVVNALREDGDLTLSLVATNMDEAIIGHIAFSPVTISDGTPGWYAAGPISVMPTRQRAGIGSQIATEGLERMKAMGAKGIVLLSDPGAYARFGFTADPDLILPGFPPANLHVNKLGEGPRPKGTVRYAKAFGYEAAD